MTLPSGDRTSTRQDPAERRTELQVRQALEVPTRVLKTECFELSRYQTKETCVGGPGLFSRTKTKASRSPALKDFTEPLGSRLTMRLVNTRLVSDRE